MSQNPQSAIDKGLKFLDRDQEKDGSFMCLVSTKLDDYEKAKTVPAIVPTNIVLSSLIRINGNVSNKIKQKAANFLLGEKNEYWSFNYWFKKSNWFKREPYPDDLDDTFCALAALYEYDSGLFDGEAMAKIATMLASAEKQEGGPYDMWLVPEEGRKTWNDTDLVVNSNVAFFLALQDISLPKLNAFIEKSIDSSKYEFPYNKIYPAIYFISRFYGGKKTTKMIKLLLSRQEPDGKWENPLRTALAISSLMNFSGDKYRVQIEKGIAYLLKSQAKNGSWKPYSFYFQMRTPTKTLYAGSSSITTALCLETMNKFSALDRNSSKETRLPALERSNPPAHASQWRAGSGQEIYARAVKMVKERFSSCEGDLKNEAARVIAKTLKGDKDKQIVLLPYLFRATLGENGKDIPDELVARLGAASTFGWISYTIYDDFLDDEGDPKLLSVGNVALRESSEIFGNVLPPESKFAEFSRDIFDVIDGANCWEVRNCRFDPKVGIKKHALPDYGNYSQLANKSLGHSLGPIAILFALGHGKNSPEVKNMMEFFSNYIIARQLNDDAHDWEDDLKNGQINAVAVEILKNKTLRDGSLDNLQKFFWEKTVIQVCKNILRHTREARKNLSIVKGTEIFEKLLVPIELSVEKALKERIETLKFVRTYGK